MTGIEHAESELLGQAGLHAAMLRTLSRLGVGVVVVEGERIVYANDAALQLTGRTRDELPRLGPITDLVVPEQRAHLRERMERRLRGEAVEQHYETAVLHRDGRRIDIEVAIDRVDDADPPRLVVVARDISERKRLAEQLLRAQRLEIAGRVAGQVAHDFNNLLAPLAGYPELIKLQLPAAHPAVGFCDAMLAAAQQMAEISEDLLTLGRRGTLRLTPLDLNEVVARAIKQLPPRPETLELELRLDRRLAPIRGARGQLMRVVANLVRNAREALEDRGRIVVSTQNAGNVGAGKAAGAPNGYARLSVSDDGPGIPIELQERIFDAFFSTKATGRRHGSGLGLSVVQAIAEDHNGWVTVESAPGRGARFDVYLPFDHAGHSAAARTAELPAPELPRGFETILIVDDDPAQREVLRHQLQSLGYRVQAVPSGEAALTHLRLQRADLLVLDMLLGEGIDGVETFRRARLVRPDQRAIVVSAYAEEDRLQRARALGATIHLRKPVDLDQLARAVREGLDR